ncbi:MAG: hypothetical protein ACRELE_08660 [Gemmatimonadales bacterium]
MPASVRSVESRRGDGLGDFMRFTSGPAFDGSVNIRATSDAEPGDNGDTGHPLSLLCAPGNVTSVSNPTGLTR